MSTAELTSYEKRLLAIGVVHYDLELIADGGNVPDGMPTPEWVQRAWDDINTWQNLVTRGLATHLKNRAGRCDTYRAVLDAGKAKP